MKFVATFEGMQKLFVFGDNSVARACVRDMVVHVCFGERENSKVFMENLMARLARIGYKEFPLHILAIESLIVLEDGLMEERVLIFVVYSVELTKSYMNQSYIGFSYVTDLFIKLALKINAIHVRVQNEWNKFSHIEKWLKKREYPIPNAVLLCTSLDLLGAHCHEKRRSQVGAVGRRKDLVQSVHQTQTRHSLAPQANRHFQETRTRPVCRHIPYRKLLQSKGSRAGHKEVL